VFASLAGMPSSSGKVQQENLLAEEKKETGRSLEDYSHNSSILKDRHKPLREREAL